jgi:hypothetical protein
MAPEDLIRTAVVGVEPMARQCRTARRLPPQPASPGHLAPQTLDCPPWRCPRLVTASLALDDLIVSSGVSYRALLMPSFMDNLLRQVESIRDQGTFFLPIAGDRKLPSCATRDIASATARLLLDRSWTGTGTVPVMGPEDLSYNDMAQIILDVLAKPVRFQQIPGEAYRTRLLERGMSEAMAQGNLDMLLAKNQELDNTQPRTAESTTSTSFQQWCEEVLRPRVLTPAAA